MKLTIEINYRSTELEEMIKRLERICEDVKWRGHRELYVDKFTSPKVCSEVWLELGDLDE